jgi:hypothetical protein
MQLNRPTRRLPEDCADRREGDGYLAALTNFRFIANALWSTGETLERLKAAG